MGSVGFVVVVLGVIVFALFSNRAQRLLLTAPMAFTFFGLAIGDAGLGLLELEIEGSVVHGLAEITLVVVLFTDAARIDLRLLVREHDVPVRLLAFGLPLTIALGAGVAMAVLPGFSWPTALVLAAVLAPTDAALGQAVVTSPRVPVRIRQALNVESGLNDGITLPAVLLFVCFTGLVDHDAGGASYWLRFIVLQLTLGPLAGVAVCWTGGKLLARTRERGWAAEPFQAIAVLGMAFLSFGLAEWIGGNGFIAAFCGGITIGNTARGLCHSLYEFMEAEGQLLGLLVFMLFGAVFVPESLEHLGPRTLLYAALSLTLIRMLPVAVSLIGTRVRAASVLFLGWFGPRGLASIVFALLVVEEAGVSTGGNLEAVVTVTVLLSIVAHGISAGPGVRAYADHIECPPGEEPSPEHAEVTPMPTRFSSPG